MTRARRISTAFLAGLLLTPAIAASRTAVVRPPRAGERLTIAGGSKAQRRLARLVAVRVGGVTLRSVRFQRPSKVLRHMHVRASELVVTSSEPRTLRGEWEARLYGGTFAALAARYRVPLGGIAAGEGVGPVRLWPRFDLYTGIPTARQIAALTTQLTAAAAKANATVLELRVASTPARAIALTLQVDDPAAFLEHRALAVLNVLYRTKTPLLGFYIGLRETGGGIVWATSRLANEGGVFATPALDACSPVKHSQVGLHELPCPAK